MCVCVTSDHKQIERLQERQRQNKNKNKNGFWFSSKNEIADTNIMYINNTICNKYNFYEVAYVFVSF